MHAKRIWLVVSLLTLGGCTTESNDGAARAAAATPASEERAVAATPAAANTPATVAATPAPAAATPVPAGAPVLASGDGERAGSRAEIHELKRNSGGTVTLKFSIVNDSDESFDFGYYMGAATKDVGSIADAHLVDPAAKKKYLVVRDSDGTCLCSRKLPDLGRSRINLWAKFPAPPEGVERLTVVLPHFMPMDDVPLTP